jgi:hypothetical protein
MLSKKVITKNLEFEKILSEIKNSPEENYQVKVTKVYVPNSTDWHYKIGSE